MPIHPIAPVYDTRSRILILGSFPSVKSREEGFFYGYRRNRFWAVIARVCGEAEPCTIKGKRSLLLSNNIAVWDVIASCDIVGSSDSSISNVKPNDLNAILSVAPIERIYVNGKTAEKYYNKYILPKIGIKAIALPSTSPANAAWTIDKLADAWSIIKGAK